MTAKAFLYSRNAFVIAAIISDLLPRSIKMKGSWSITEETHCGPRLGMLSYAYTYCKPSNIHVFFKWLI